MTERPDGAGGALDDVLIVTGMAGAGKSTVLKTLEDAGWEVVDNLPLTLLDRATAPPMPGTKRRSLAIGIGTQTRGFDTTWVETAPRHLRDVPEQRVSLLFLDCTSVELERRYAETRRRHPLALDRSAGDGIAQERKLLAPLRRSANRLIDTTQLSAAQLAQEIRDTVAGADRSGPTLTLTSFGFARGLPRNADLVFDARFLRNPHWVPELKAGTGLDADVAAYVAADPAYEEAVGRFEELLLVLLPRYRVEGKSYVSVAIGCTGGRHRSVHLVERVAKRLREAGFSPTVQHRDLPDVQEARPGSQASQ